MFELELDLELEGRTFSFESSDLFLLGLFTYQQIYMYMYNGTVNLITRHYLIYIFDNQSFFRARKYKKNAERHSIALITG